MRLTGRAALVTGAASGLGYSIAKALCNSGAKVAIADLDSADIEKAASTITGALPVSVDVRDSDLVRTMVDVSVAELGTLDIVVNNAGLQRINRIEDFDEREWRLVIDTMVTGTFLCTKYSLPHLRRSAFGRVVNIASVHSLVASPLKSAYVAAKHGVLGFTKALALEEAGNEITANAVCPGYVRTSLVERQITMYMDEHNATEPEAVEALLDPVAIKRLLEPDEVAELVVYLASDAARSITGSAFTIDCGWTAH